MYLNAPMFASALALAVALLGCAAKRDEPASPPLAAATPTAAGPALGAATAAITLRRLEAGDRACYVVVVTDGAGEERSLLGDFELCPGGGGDATGLVGQPVVVETRPESVPAESCQGQPDCTDSETVELVVAIRPAG
jgi:hypothetical protein